MEVIYGVHPILEVVRAKKRRIKKVYVARSSTGEKRVLAVLPKWVLVERTDRKAIAKICGSEDHMGVAAVVDDFVYTTRPPRENERLVLVLENLQDPRNLGAILRSARCLGFSYVFLTGKRASPVTATVMKTSAGLAEYLRVRRLRNLKDVISELKERKFSILSTVVNGGRNISEIEAPLERLALLIGNEEGGLSREAVASGLPVTIPQADQEASLNASVAAGIAMYVARELTGG